MKQWFYHRFLPMWAKETVLADNRTLKRKLAQLQQENERLRSYIRGVHAGIRRKGEKK